MTLSVCSHSSVVALGYDGSTNERGFLVKMINRTGGASVKGMLVATSSTADREVIAQTNEYDTIGVAQEAVVAEGSEIWVWMNGSVAQVLYKDGAAAVRGTLALSADTDGRAIDTVTPGAGLPASDTHFKEIGHVMQSATAGTNVLALVCLHFN